MVEKLSWNPAPIEKCRNYKPLCRPGTWNMDSTALRMFKSLQHWVGSGPLFCPGTWYMLSAALSNFRPMATLKVWSAGYKPPPGKPLSCKFLHFAGIQLSFFYQFVWYLYINYVLKGFNLYFLLFHFIFCYINWKFWNFRFFCKKSWT